MNNILQYKYSVREVLDAVTARTSFVAKSKGTPEVPDRMDDLTLTEGEFDTFMQLLKQACADMFEYTAPFCRGVRPGYVCGGDLYDDIIFSQEESWHFDENKVMSIKNGILEAIVNHIMSKWFFVVLPEEAANYWTLFEDAAFKVKQAMDSEKFVMKRRTSWLH